MLQRHQNTSDLLRNIAKEGSQARSLKKIDTELSYNNSFNLKKGPIESTYESRQNDKSHISAGESLKNHYLNSSNIQEIEFT